MRRVSCEHPCTPHPELSFTCLLASVLFLLCFEPSWVFLASGGLSVAVSHRLPLPQWAGLIAHRWDLSSPTRDRTLAPCIARRVLSHCTTGLNSRCLVWLWQCVLRFVYSFTVFILASLVAQRVTNLPIMQETWVQSLGLGRSPGGGNGNPLQCFCLGSLMDRGAWWVMVYSMGLKELDMTERLTLILAETCFKPLVKQGRVQITK